MKKFRKLFAVLTASALVGAMSFTTMAATISIKNAEQNTQTYTAYKILDATKGIEAGVASYTMDVTSPLVAALTDKKQTWLDYKLSADGKKYIVTLKAANSKDTAKDIADYFKDKLSGVTPIELNSTHSSEKVDDGYYLIKSSFGTDMILATSDIEITEKNEGPQDDKKVETGSLTIGESATYYITVVVPATVNTEEAITVHDVLPSELSFNGDVKVFADDTSNDLNASTPVNELKKLAYGDLFTGTTVKNDELGDNCTFHIEINPKNNPDQYVGKTLVFKYSATLQDAAYDEDGSGFVNKEFLDYSNYTTTEKHVPVMTYDFDLTKTFKESTAEQTELTATFNLYTAEEYGKLTDNKSETVAEAMKFKSDKYGYYVSAATEDTDENIEAVKGNSVNVRGLGEGTYYLVETATASGYNVLDHAISITVTATYDKTTGHVSGGVVSIKNGKAESNDAVEVENVKGFLLPSTGGMGTVAFAVVGLIVMAGAAITLIIKKRA